MYADEMINSHKIFSVYCILRVFKQKTAVKLRLLALPHTDIVAYLSNV